MKLSKSNRICDFCGNVYKEVTHKIKIKRRWYAYGAGGWEKVDLCDECAKDMVLWMKQKRMLKKMVNKEIEKR